MRCSGRRRILPKPVLEQLHIAVTAGGVSRFGSCSVRGVRPDTFFAQGRFQQAEGWNVKHFSIWDGSCILIGSRVRSVIATFMVILAAAALGAIAVTAWSLQKTTNNCVGADA